MLRICIIQSALGEVSETFIRAHGDLIPGVVGTIYRQGQLPAVNGSPVLSQRSSARLVRKVSRLCRRRTWKHEIESGYVAALRRLKPDVVLAEYGPNGVAISPACQKLDIPLVVHFHGYDASVQNVLDEHCEDYCGMFRRAAVVIAVSRAMEQKLRSLGCPSDKLIYSPYGIDCNRFCGACPEQSESRFVAVGRLVEKKAPHLTLLAFGKLLERAPEARLCIIGDGPYAPLCKDLAVGLRIDHAVTFLGAQPHEIVQQEMRRSRAFVQHSVTASSGDSEGTPVAVLEAGAMGLPVVSTRHAGIPDVVIEGKTGLLVNERDVTAMSEHLLSIAHCPQLACRLGTNAAEHIRKYYTLEQSLNRLSRVLAAAAERASIISQRQAIEAELPGVHPHSKQLNPS